RLAHQIYAEVKDRTAKEPAQRFWHVLAAKKCKELSPRLPQPEDHDAFRRGVVQRALDAAAEARRQNKPWFTKGICLNLVALCKEGCPEVKEQVEKAERLLKELR